LKLSMKQMLFIVAGVISTALGTSPRIRDPLA
jgi:hypothetical protein